MTATPVQLALSVRLDDSATYENFCQLDSLNHPAIVNFLMTQFRGHGVAEESFCYLWGSTGSGASHLLQACCHSAHGSDLTAQYLPLSECREYSADALLEGLAQLDVICLDNVNAVMGDKGWESALFTLYNQIREQGARLLVSADAPPRELDVALPDLASRFGWGPVFHLQTLDDHDKCQILQFRANALGISLTDEVARYLLNRFDRNLSSLMGLLTDLDRASLQQQRKITIPFIRELFKNKAAF